MRRKGAVTYLALVRVCSAVGHGDDSARIELSSNKDRGSRTK